MRSNPDKTAREPPDMDRLMAQLALIRAQVESERPAARRPSVNLIRLLLLLIALVLVPLVWSQVCVGLDQGARSVSPVYSRPGEVTPHPVR